MKKIDAKNEGIVIGLCLAGWILTEYLKAKEFENMRTKVRSLEYEVKRLTDSHGMEEDGTVTHRNVPSILRPMSTFPKMPPMEVVIVERTEANVPD